MSLSKLHLAVPAGCEVTRWDSDLLKTLGKSGVEMRRVEVAFLWGKFKFFPHLPSFSMYTITTLRVPYPVPREHMSPLGSDHPADRECLRAGCHLPTLFTPVVTRKNSFSWEAGDKADILKGTKVFQNPQEAQWKSHQEFRWEDPPESQVSHE